MITPLYDNALITLILYILIHGSKPLEEEFIYEYSHSATKSQIADIVLLPGAPLRGKVYRRNIFRKIQFLTIPLEIMLGLIQAHTKVKKVSVQGTEWEMPSAVCIFNELINDYGVKDMIRLEHVPIQGRNYTFATLIIAQGCKQQTLTILTT